MEHEESVARLVALIEQKLAKRVPADKPLLRVLETAAAASAAPAAPAFRLDPLAREHHVRMIGFMARHFGLQAAADLTPYGVGRLEDLDDLSLTQVYRKVDSARIMLGRHRQRA